MWWNVVFPGKLFAKLNDFLFSTAPTENGCFLLANSFGTQKLRGMTVTDVLKPDESSWNRSGEHSLEPSSAYINDCVVKADNTSQSLIFVHTHPNSLHPVGFSPIDEHTNKRIFSNLSQILPDRPLGSLVFSSRGIAGVAYDQRRQHTIQSVKVVGSAFNDMHTFGSFKVPEGRSVFDRQIRVLGEYRQVQLQNLGIAIVGVGGTGSSVAVQLARMGVKDFTLIDMDEVDDSNVPRLYGSSKKDVGKPKVDVLKKHIATFSDARITPINSNIAQAGSSALDQLLDADIIFGCTDNLASRAVLNDISIQYYIPLIDVGCRIVLDKDGVVDQSVVKVQTVTPDHACLWCTGTLDGQMIVQESYSDSEKEKLAKEGYYQGVIKQPSIVSLTTLAASIGVNKLLALLGTYGSGLSSLTQIELKNGFMMDDSPGIKHDCVCLKRRGKADSRRIM
jgi:hypothetical protein